MNLFLITGNASILFNYRGKLWHTLDFLRQHFDRIDVICPHPSTLMSEYSGKMTPSLERSDLQNVFIHAKPLNMSMRKWILQQGKQVHAAVGIDVISVRDYSPFAFTRPAAALSKSIRIPMILEVQHLAGLETITSQKEKWKQFVSKVRLTSVKNQISKVRVSRGDVQTELASYGFDPSIIEFISEVTVDIETIAKIEPPPIAWDVCFCGRIIPRKGISQLIDAVASIKNCRMLIIGDGSIKEEMEQKVQDLYLDGRITFTGWFSEYSAVISAIKGTRMLVVPSRADNGPQVLLEAMACGIATIGTPVGIIPDIIEHNVNGLITTGTVQDMAAKIEYLMEHVDQRRKLAFAGQSTVAEFNKSDVLLSYVKFLQSVRS